MFFKSISPHLGIKKSSIEVQTIQNKHPKKKQVAEMQFYIISLSYLYFIKSEFQLILLFFLSSQTYFPHRRFSRE